MKLQSSFIEITPRHGVSPVNLLHIFRTPFTKSTSERLLLATIFFFFAFFLKLLNLFLYMNLLLSHVIITACKL